MRVPIRLSLAYDSVAKFSETAPEHLALRTRLAIFLEETGYEVWTQTRWPLLVLLIKASSGRGVAGRIHTIYYMSGSLPPKFLVTRDCFSLSSTPHSLVFQLFLGFIITFDSLLSTRESSFGVSVPQPYSLCDGTSNSRNAGTQSLRLRGEKRKPGQ
jgi:hypothetical protein